MIVRLEIVEFGDIDIELDFNQAPKTAQNFVDLVKKGFYDGLTFHRIIKGFMIQGGCPIGNGTGGPGYTIEGEFKANGINNTISHVRGVVSMARAMSYNSGGSQFFIMHKDGTYLDGQYAAFGKVINGMDVVDKIANVRTGVSDRPLSRVIIAKAHVIE